MNRRKTDQYDPSLSQYISDIYKNKMLTQEQELEAAKEIQGLEIYLWKVILSYPPLYKTIAVVVRNKTDYNNIKPLLQKLLRSTNTARQQEIITRLVDELYDLDSNRTIVSKICETIAAIPPSCNEHKRFVNKIESAKYRLSYAKNNFVTRYLRLVISIAKRYRRRGVSLIDLIQEGNIGLMTAIDQFDYRLGNRFSTYASWWIRAAINRAIANTGHTIRLPVYALA